MALSYYNDDMSWAMRRSILYILGIFIFFALVIGLPLAIYFHQPASCHDGVQNQNETSPDHGGPCVILDERALTPNAILWTRAFKVRDGLYDATAYVLNPNETAGVVTPVSYQLGLYDNDNVLVVERTGATYLMPGGITPVFEGGIDIGNRTVARARFQFTEPMMWDRVLKNITSSIEVNDKQIADTTTEPRLRAEVMNKSVEDLIQIVFVATVFDQADNAFASSATALPRLNAGETQQIVFTWSAPFTATVGRIDIIPSYPPTIDPAAAK